MEDEPVKVGEVFKCLLAQDTRGHILPIRLFPKYIFQVWIQNWLKYQ